MVDIDFTVKKEGGVQAGTPLSPDISHRIEGGEDLEAAIQSSLRQLGIPVLGALVEEGEDIMAVSKERVPKRTGALQASGRVQITQSGKDGIEVTLGYGDFNDVPEDGTVPHTAIYAVDQHENPDYRHAEGRTWKYLEQPMMEAVQGMGERLAERIRARISFGGSPDGGEEFDA
jgi:hypothetical protein